MNSEAEPIVSAGRRGAVARFVLSAFVAFATAVAMADVKVWTGEAGTASLKDGGNWYGGVVPHPATLPVTGGKVTLAPHSLHIIKL